MGERETDLGELRHADAGEQEIKEMAKAARIDRAEYIRMDSNRLFICGQTFFHTAPLRHPLSDFHHLHMLDPVFIVGCSAGHKSQFAVEVLQISLSRDPDGHLRIFLAAF